MSFGSKIKRISGKMSKSSFNPLKGRERTDGNSLESHEWVYIKQKQKWETTRCYKLAMLLVPFIMEVGRFWYLLPIIDDVIVTVGKRVPIFRDLFVFWVNSCDECLFSLHVYGYEKTSGSVLCRFGSLFGLPWVPIWSIFIKIWVPTSMLADPY